MFAVLCCRIIVLFSVLCCTLCEKVHMIYNGPNPALQQTIQLHLRKEFGWERKKEEKKRGKEKEIKGKQIFYQRVIIDRKLHFNFAKRKLQLHFWEFSAHLAIVRNDP